MLDAFVIEEIRRRERERGRDERPGIQIPVQAPDRLLVVGAAPVRRGHHHRLRIDPGRGAKIG